MVRPTPTKVVTFEDDLGVTRQTRITRSQSPTKQMRQGGLETSSRSPRPPSSIIVLPPARADTIARTTTSQSPRQTVSQNESDKASRSTKSRSPTNGFYKAVSDTFKRKSKTPSPTKPSPTKRLKINPDAHGGRQQGYAVGITPEADAISEGSSPSTSASESTVSSSTTPSSDIEGADDENGSGSEGPEDEESQDLNDQNDEQGSGELEDEDAEDEDVEDVEAEDEEVEDEEDEDEDEEDEEDEVEPESDAIRHRSRAELSVQSNGANPEAQQPKHVRRSLEDFKRAMEQVTKASTATRRTFPVPSKRGKVDNGEITQLQLASLEHTLQALEDPENPFGARFKALKEENMATTTAPSQTLDANDQVSTVGSPPTNADPTNPDLSLGQAYNPVRFVYPQHPHGEHSDDWWTRAVHQLYKKVLSCAEIHLGQADIEIDEDAQEGSYWAKAHTTPELESYISMIAEADPHNGGWDRFLTEKSQRQYLVAAIIAKVLEVKVFNTLLFGAEKDQLEFLEELEKKFLDHEGYERTALRASTIRTMLDSHPITPLFSHSVLSLSHQLFALLLPFDHAQRDKRIRKQTNNRHSFAEGVHVCEPDACLQDLHDIVGMAGYLSICMRLSKTIMFIRSDVPGERYEEEHQFNVDHGLYLSSKTGVERYKMEMKQGMSIDEMAKVNEEQYSPRIKIALWPSFKRYSPGSGRLGGERSGFRVYDVSKSGVVYYWAAENRANRGNPSFKAFVGKAKSGEKFGWLKHKLFWYMS